MDDCEVFQLTLFYFFIKGDEHYTTEGTHLTVVSLENNILHSLSTTPRQRKCPKPLKENVRLLLH